MAINLHYRSISYFKEMDLFLNGYPTIAFSNIRWNRNRCASQLITKCISFLIREFLEKLIYCYDHLP